MLSLLLAAQLAVPDSLYSSPALRELVGEAVRQNRAVPATLGGYRATVESEIAIVARRTEGSETVFSLEQIRSDVQWRRTGEFEQHVVGYRSQAVGLSLSSLGFLRSAWTVPTLYGNRINLLFGRDTTRRRYQRRMETRLVAVHPLAEDRERVYRFSGGDTVVTMRVNGRAIPIVRVRVEPRSDVPARTVVFRGDLDLDMTRHQLVRMRGHFVAVAPPRALLDRAMTLGGFDAIAFIELENAEIDVRYWLPVYQRFEVQASWALVTDARSIFRIISRFRDHTVEEAATVANGDTLTAHPYRLTFAPPDSIARFSAWRAELGMATNDVHAEDFDDVAPDTWRDDGVSRLALRVQRLSDALHFNKIEGAYTGWGTELRLRDMAPGVTLRANGGWAWSEKTARGRGMVEWKRDAWTYTVRAGRSLDITNDFRSAFDSGTTLGALLFSIDVYDYVDRRSLALGAARVIGLGRAGIMRFETGPARDAAVERHVTRGIARVDSGFRENRGVRGGNYWRTWAALEWHPDVNAEFMRTGVGALVSVENAAGGLSYTRLEGRLMARKNRGLVTLAGRADAGFLLGDSPPPQQLFELGSGQNLLGYGEKEFAGTHAAVVRGLAMYRLPLFRTPMRAWRWMLPAPAPALAVGAQGAWAEVRGPGGEAALRELGTRTLAVDSTTFPNPSISVPVSRLTDGLRTSVSGGLRFFGGSLGVSLARPLDRKARWRVVFDFAQLL